MGPLAAGHHVSTFSQGLFQPGDHPSSGLGALITQAVGWGWAQREQKFLHLRPAQGTWPSALTLGSSRNDPTGVKSSGIPSVTC